MAWWCVKLLNWRHVRHTLFSGVCRGNMQDIFWSAFARAERWGTPVIWAPKKDVSQGCAFDSQNIYDFDDFGSHTTSKLWLKELCGFACCLAKVFLQHFRTEPKISNRKLLLTKLAMLFPLEKSFDFLAIWGNTIQVQSNYRPLPQSSTGGYQCICHFCTYFSQSVFTGHQSAHKRERICPRWTHSQTFQCWIRRQILCSLMFALELSCNLFSLGILGSSSHVGQIRI